MEILNVGAGQTNEEHGMAEEGRRADLRADSQADANYFFWAAALAALGTGLLPVRIGFLVNVGAVDLLALYGAPLREFYSLALYGAASIWLTILIILGFAGRAGHRLAFLAGIVLYGADMIGLMMMFSLWAFGVHSFFVYKWFEGYKTLKELKQSSLASS